MARFSDLLGDDDPNESSEATDSAQPGGAAATDDTAATDAATPTGDAGEMVAGVDEPSADVWAPDAPLDVPSPEEPDAAAEGVDDAVAESHDADMTTEEPASVASPRATFSELAREQAVRAAEEDADDDRVRALGLERLPKIDDDLLPGH